MLPLTVELLALPKEVAEVRRMVEGDDVRLCVSELLTNVIRHVGEGTPVTVRVAAARGGRTRVAVSDPDPACGRCCGTRRRTPSRGGGSRCWTRWRRGGAWTRGRTARRSGANWAQGASRSETGAVRMRA